MTVAVQKDRLEIIPATPTTAAAATSTVTPTTSGAPRPVRRLLRPTTTGLATGMTTHKNAGATTTRHARIGVALSRPRSRPSRSQTRRRLSWTSTSRPSCASSAQGAAAPLRVAQVQEGSLRHRGPRERSLEGKMAFFKKRHGIESYLADSAAMVNSPNDDTAPPSKGTVSDLERIIDDVDEDADREDRALLVEQILQDTFMTRSPTSSSRTLTSTWSSASSTTRPRDTASPGTLEAPKVDGLKPRPLRRVLRLK